MVEEQKVTELANTLFSKGLAASLWDAKNKAKDILGIKDAEEKKPIVDERQAVEAVQEKSALNGLMREAGVNVGEVEKAEEKKIEEIKEEFQKKLAETTEEQVPKEEAKEVPSQPEKPAESSAGTNDILQGVDGLESVELPSDLFEDAVEGASPEMLVGQAANPEAERVERELGQQASGLDNREEIAQLMKDVNEAEQVMQQQASALSENEEAAQPAEKAAEEVQATEQQASVLADNNEAMQPAEQVPDNVDPVSRLKEEVKQLIDEVNMPEQEMQKQVAAETTQIKAAEAAEQEPKPEITDAEQVELQQDEEMMDDMVDAEKPSIEDVEHELEKKAEEAEGIFFVDDKNASVQETDEEVSLERQEETEKPAPENVSEQESKEESDDSNYIYLGANESEENAKENVFSELDNESIKEESSDMENEQQAADEESQGENTLQEEEQQPTEQENQEHYI